MHEHATISAQETALARFAVIAPLVARKLTLSETRTIRQSILEQLHLFPGEKARRVAPRTLRRWVATYRAALPKGTLAALDALYRLGRSDKGIPRVFDAAIIEEAVNLRIEIAERSTRDLLAHFKDAPKESTLAYHLRQRGATKKMLKQTGRAFPRYEAATVNATWQSDVMDGFFLPDPVDPTRFKEVHLMGFIDDHSRLITHAEWYFKESLPCLFDCFKKAVSKNGCPALLYWDNGPIYRSHQVKLVAARLGGKVTFSTPYCPEGKGKIERFWKTTARSFLVEAKHAEIPTLEALNQCFWAWLERYHHTVHKSTRMTPFERWEAGADQVRFPNPAEIHEIFLWEDARIVKKTGTLSLAGNEYQVDDSLVGKKVEVRYDPLDLATVHVYLGGKFLQVAAPYKLVAHTHRKATPQKQDAKYLPLPSSKRLLQTATASHQAAAATAFAAVLESAPTEKHPDRLDYPELRLLIGQTLRRTLNSDEDAAITRFFQHYAPLSRDRATLTLAAVVATKGPDRHLDFYLGEIAPTRGAQS
jgi:transposase InsO family protein